MTSIQRVSESQSTPDRKSTSRKKKATSSLQKKRIACQAGAIANGNGSKPKNVPFPDSRDRKTDALRRAGVKREDLIGVPQISHILKHAEHGLAQVIDALRGYDEEDAQDFIEKYDSLSPSDRARLSIEEICVAAGVKTLDLLGCATKALVLESQTVSSIIAATSHYRVVNKTVKMALEDGGHRDREMLHTATGFLPSPKGSTFINKVQVANFSDDKKQPATVDAIPDEEDLVSVDDDLMGLDAFERKMLPAAK